MVRYYEGWTRRSNGPIGLGPLLHAVHDSLPRYSRTGKTYRAACGTQVRNVGGPFSSATGRRCPKCVKAVEGGRSERRVSVMGGSEVESMVDRLVEGR